METKIDQRLINIFQQLSIQHQTYFHETAPTCEIHSQVMSTHLKDQLDNVVLCKNLFYRHKKKPFERFLVVTSSNLLVNHADMGRFLGIGSGGNLRFVDKAEMLDLLGVQQGSVSPLALINDNERRVDVVLEKKLVDQNMKLGLHPFCCDATTIINAKDLVRYIQHFGHKLKLVDFDDRSIAENKSSGTLNKKPHKSGGGGTEQLGLSCTRQANFARWYSEVVTKGEMIEYYDISGCYILRPNSCFIQRQIQRFFDIEIAKMGIEDAYFPMFVSKKALEAEASHIDGFKTEVAWVTKTGDHDLQIPIAIRPTSETVMYPIYGRQIKSHRDLPIRLNQQANIVRCEFKKPTPFIRSREFLQQEGHSAFASKKEADLEVHQILDLYARIYEEQLAVPVIKGVKTESEKFPGGDYTTTVETFIEHTGRSVQGATSHGLGQNFGKIFDISFEDEKRCKQIPQQNSQGITTRTIGVMIMQHGDDKGLVIPPKVSRYQVVIIPIKTKSSDKKAVIEDEFTSKYKFIHQCLVEEGFRAFLDDKSNYKPGQKYNHQELHGVPLRIEFGPRDLKNNQCVLARRDTGAKQTIGLNDLVDEVKKLLDEIQSDMLRKARQRLEKSKRIAMKQPEFEQALADKCYVLSPSCNRVECEESIKKRTKLCDEAPTNFDSENKELNSSSGDIFTDQPQQQLTGSAKSLCIPFEQPHLKTDTCCVACDQLAKKWIYYGRSY